MRRLLLLSTSVLVLWCGPLAAQDAEQPPLAAKTLAGAVERLIELVEPTADAPARTFTAMLKISRAEGAPALVGAEMELAYQSPDRLMLSTVREGNEYRTARDGREIWVHVPGKKFGVVGAPGVVKFSADPASVDRTELGAFRFPVSRLQLAMTLMAMQPVARGDEVVGEEKCRVVRMSPPEALTMALGWPAGTVEVAVRERDDLPVRFRVRDGRGVDVQVEVVGAKLEKAWDSGRWKIQANPGDTIERVAVSHLTNFLSIAAVNVHQNIPTLSPATGKRQTVARTGEGRLEMQDGTRVLFLKGTAEAMGRQQGTLLAEEVRSLTRRVLYGVGVGSSFAKGDWFFGEIERAQARLAPFISEATFAEMDALAKATGLHPQEVRLANFFPELFHCSGFALTGEATVGGRMYHGRILDYLRGIGLEQNAVVTVYRPMGKNAWVNVGYAGFIGSVTGMNEKHISIGEMGGRGEGNWDGKPMAQLVREVMEKAGTLEDAVEIMRTGPRTCEYYYVIADGKSKKAVGIEATPEKFVTVALGESHPKLPRAMKDCVLLSADDRYIKLVERVKENYGKIDDGVARSLMERPVAMGSNIHSVLFAPDTLDFWVANADSKNPASHARYTKYNLRELLESAPAK